MGGSRGWGTGGPDLPGKPHVAISVPLVQLLLEGGTFVWPSVNFLMTKKTLSIRDGKFPDLKVNDKQLQTANLVYIFDEIILSVTASKYGMTTVEIQFHFYLYIHPREVSQKCKP